MSYIILKNSRVPDAIVLPEDFDTVAAQFADMIRDRNWAALPGGVMDTIVPSRERYDKFVFDANDFRGYRLDSDDYLAADKSVISSALSTVEGRELLDADFTLCPSASLALLFTMLALKRKGIATMVTELPAYFGCVDQAMTLGLRTVLWPTVPDEGYSIAPSDVRHIRKNIEGPLFLLLTQPRYTMGYIRPAKYFADVRAELHADDFLVVDEAADQANPATLGGIDLEGEVPLIRVRGLLKGLGLNSARVATILHPRSWRSQFSEIVDYAGGNLDSASLKVATSICAEPERYRELLRAAQSYVQERYRDLKSSLRGLPIALSPIESGYVGTAHIPFNVHASFFFEERGRFLQLCRDERMPVVVGSNMYFPYDKRSEMFRVNYFVSRESILQSARVIAKVVERFNVPKTGQPI